MYICCKLTICNKKKYFCIDCSQVKSEEVPVHVVRKLIKMFYSNLFLFRAKRFGHFLPGIDKELLNFFWKMSIIVLMINTKSESNNNMSKPKMRWPWQILSDFKLGLVQDFSVRYRLLNSLAKSWQSRQEI
jgi:hypothetical protein